MFRNVDIQISDAGELPRRKHRKFELSYIILAGIDKSTERNIDNKIILHLKY